MSTPFRKIDNKVHSRILSDQNKERMEVRAEKKGNARLSDGDSTGQEIHQQGFAPEKLCPNQDVLGLSGDGVDRTAPTIENDLTQVDLLLDERPGCDFKLFRPDSLPLAKDKQPSRNTQVTVESRVNNCGEDGRAVAEDQLNSSDRLSVTSCPTFKHI